MIRSKAPGRICLFGEHQDYIGFPIIAAAINLHISIEGAVSPGSHIDIFLPDIKERENFDSENFTYQKKRDYLKGAVSVLKKKNLFCQREIHAILRGTIPIQAGVSSSSALAVAWTGFLLQAGDVPEAPLNDLQRIADLAYFAEVEEFGESGGRMDHYASALGGIIFVEFHPEPKIQPLPMGISEFVLGDSRQPKPTQKTLNRIRTAYEEGFAELRSHLNFDHPHSLSLEQAEPFLEKISGPLRPYIAGALKNHRITDAAREELIKETPDIQKIASLMNGLQEILRDNLKLSTPKLDRMLEASLKAGALSAKINGSGEGGCIIAFCPGRQEEVAEAIRQTGGIPHLIQIGPGLSVESI